MGAPYTGPACALQPDGDAIWSFLTWWFHPCNRGVVELGWMDTGGRGLVHFQRFETEDEAIIPFAIAVNSTPGQSLYFRAATIDAEAPEGRTTDAHVLQAPGLWADQDRLEDVERAQTVTSVIRANGVVVTGRHPHLRQQLFVRSSEPILGLDNIRSLNRRLRAVYGGDPAVSNPSRLMRLPGCIAWPWKPDRVPELVELQIPDDGRPRAYAVHTLGGVLPREPEQQQASLPERETINTGLNTARGLMERIRAGKGGWHNDVVRLVAHWVGRGWSNAEIIAAAESLTLPGYTGADTRREIAKAVEGARAKWAVPDPEPVLEAGPTGLFPLLTMQDAIDMRPPSWLVPGLIPERGFAVLYGPPGSLKSFLALDLGLRLAHGLPWLGRPLSPCPVLFIAGEGAGSLGKRLEAWRVANGVREVSPGFRLLPQAVNLMEAAEVDRLIATVRQASFRPALIVADTLSRCMVGADENSAQHMGIAIAAGARLQAELGCAFLPIHHTGKDAERGMRGSNALLGATDTVLKAARTDERVSLHVERQKDDEDGQTFYLRALRTDLPSRNSIVGRSSLVLVPDDALPPEPETKRPSVKPSVKLFHAVLMDALVVHSPQPGETTRATWESECVRRGLLDPLEPGDSPSARDRKRAKLRMARSALLAAGWIGIDGERVMELTRSWR